MLAAQHAHVLVVEAPGGWGIRVAVERAALNRGWRLALSPAEADVLAVCGEPGPDLARAVEQVWQQLPGPRVRIDVSASPEVSTLLDDAHDRLVDTAGHQRDAHDRPVAADLLEDQDADGAGMDMDDMDMDMDMDMAPGGIGLAEGGDDRDGLEMDVLHLPLGPVLPYWPAGLVVHCSLQGDVIVDASAELMGSTTAGQTQDVGAGRTARSVDNVASLLALAGWDDAASLARGIRDELLAGTPTEAEQRFALLQRRIRRSRMLRWSLRGVRPVDADDAQREGMPSRLAGDTHDRLLATLDRISGHFDGGVEPAGEDPSTELIARLVIGLDLATARLVVASLDLHAMTSRATQGVSHAR